MAGAVPEDSQAGTAGMRRPSADLSAPAERLAVPEMAAPARSAGQKPQAVAAARAVGQQASPVEKAENPDRTAVPQPEEPDATRGAPHADHVTERPDSPAAATLPPDVQAGAAHARTASAATTASRAAADQPALAWREAPGPSRWVRARRSPEWPVRLPSPERQPRPEPGSAGVAPQQQPEPVRPVGRPVHWSGRCPQWPARRLPADGPPHQPPRPSAKPGQVRCSSGPPRPTGPSAVPPPKGPDQRRPGGESGPGRRPAPSYGPGPGPCGRSVPGRPSRLRRPSPPGSPPPRAVPRRDPPGARSGTGPRGTPATTAGRARRGTGPAEPPAAVATEATCPPPGSAAGRRTRRRRRAFPGSANPPAGCWTRGARTGAAAAVRRTAPPGPGARSGLLCLACRISVPRVPSSASARPRARGQAATSG